MIGFLIFEAKLARSAFNKLFGLKICACPIYPLPCWLKFADRMRSFSLRSRTSSWCSVMIIIILWIFSEWKMGEAKKPRESIRIESNQSKAISYWTSVCSLQSRTAKVRAMFRISMARLESFHIYLDSVALDPRCP